MEKQYYRMRAGDQPFDPAIGAKPLSAKQTERFLRQLEFAKPERMGRGPMPSMREMSRVRNVKLKWKNK